MYLSERNAKLTLTHLQPRGDVLVVVHDGRALETYELGLSSVGCRAPRPRPTSGFMHLREITGKRMISCTYEIGKVVT